MLLNGKDLWLNRRMLHQRLRQLGGWVEKGSA